MSKLSRYLALLLLLLIPDTASAQSFTGIRPYIANSPERELSVSIPVIPNIGISNMQVLGDVPPYLKTLFGLKFPNDYYNIVNYLYQAWRLVEDINSLYGQSHFLNSFSLPAKIFSWNSKHFELRIDGGAQSHTTLRLKGLDRRLEITDVKMVIEDSTYHTRLDVGKKKLLDFRSIGLFGGDILFIIKGPIRVGKYTITPMAGVGLTLAYAYGVHYQVHTREYVGSTNILTYQDETDKGFVWGINWLAGLQFDGYKYLRPRLILQASSKPLYAFEASLFHPNVERHKVRFNLGLELKVWKIANVRAEILNLARPEYRLEISRWFLKNSEAALGVVAGSELLGRTTGYAVLSFGSKAIRVNIMGLTDGKGGGLLLGLNVGYNP